MLPQHPLFGIQDTVRHNEPDSNVIMKQDTPADSKRRQESLPKLVNQLSDAQIQASLQRKREQKASLLDPQRERRRMAAERQEQLGARPANRAVPVSKNDPLVQVRQQKTPLRKDGGSDLHISLVDESNGKDPNPLQTWRSKISDSQKNMLGDRELVVGDLNQRKLLEEDGKNMYKKKLSERQKTLDSFHAPGMDYNNRGKLLEKNSDKNPDLLSNVMQPLLQRKSVLEARERQQETLEVLGPLDVEGYLSAQRMLEGQGNSMKNFQFSQVKSDATPPNRYLKDYRHQL